MKKFKSAFALIISAVMILAMMPSAMAAIESGIKIETVSLVGSGAGFTGEDLTTVMGDNWFLNQFDRKVLDYNETASGLEANVSKMVKLTEIGDGLEFTLAEKATVKRLDLWIMSLGGIEDYKVLASENGTDYNITVAAKTFPLYNGATASTDANAVSSYYPIVFDAPVEAKSIKFVVDSFVNEATPVAYISEAKLYDTNEIDLGQNNLQRYTYNNGTKKNYYSGYSPYVSNYSSWGRIKSDKNEQSGTTSLYADKGGQMWVYSSSDISQLYVAPIYVSGASTKTLTYFWWGTTFGHSKVKVNKIGLDLAADGGLVSGGVVKEFEVWVTQNHDNMIGTQRLDPTGSSNATDIVNWTNVATINCELTNTNDDVLFELPKAVEASAIFVKVTDFEGVPALDSVKMYSVADYELTSRLENETLTGEAKAGETLTFSIYSENNNCPNAKVYFALYSNGILENVTVEPLALSAVDDRTYSVNYTIPSTATGTLSVRAFYLDGTTLVPLIDNPPTVTEG